MNCVHSFVSAVRPPIFMNSWNVQAVPEVEQLLDLDLPGIREYQDAFAKKTSNCPDDDHITASILFPCPLAKATASTISNPVDPHLDAELDSLKTLVLGQTYLGNYQTPQPIIHPRMLEVMKELLPGALSVWSDGPGSSRVVFNLSKAQGDLKVIGMYTMAERQLKIRRFKNKIKKWRALHPLNRAFEGRRQIAFTKPRLNGRFAPKETQLTPPHS